MFILNERYKPEEVLQNVLCGLSVIYGTLDTVELFQHFGIQGLIFLHSGLQYNCLHYLHNFRTTFVFIIVFHWNVRAFTF